MAHTKIEISEVNQVVDLALSANQVDQATATAVKNSILQQLRAIIEEENTEEDGEKEPRQKNQWGIVVSDPKGLITEDLVGWIVTLPENESVATILDRAHRAMYDYNTTKKGQLMPIKEIGEGFENVKRKFFKEQDLQVKTKIPVLIVRTNNILPKETTE